MFIYYIITGLIFYFLRQLFQKFRKVDYTGQNIWITGSSSGIGEALAYEYASKGGFIILSGRNLEELQRVHNKIPKNSAIVPLDLSNADEVFKKVEEVCKKYRIDILVNNAGVSQRSLFEECLENIDLERNLMEINYFSVVSMTKAVAKHMIGKKGSIVVISSVAGLIGPPGRTVYAASKSAINAYYEAMRTELMEQGIKVSIVCAGFVNTNISKNALNSKGEKSNFVDDFGSKRISPESFAKETVRKLYLGHRNIIVSGFSEKAILPIKYFFPGLATRILRIAYASQMKKFKKNQ